VIPEELAALLEFYTALDGVVTMAFPRADGAPSEIARQRLAEKFAESEAGTRLSVYFVFYLGTSQGILR